jgi:L-asparagine transporter-like permease
MKLRLKLIAKLILLVTVIMLLVTLILGGIIYYIWPENYFQWFPAIPVFFWIYGIGLAISLEKTHTEKPDSVTMTYMVARGIKIFLAILFIGIYAWFIKTNIKPFGLTTLAFYIVILVLETYAYYAYEKRRKKRKEEEEANKEPEPEKEVKSEKEIEIE